MALKTLLRNWGILLRECKPLKDVKAWKDMVRFVFRKSHGFLVENALEGWRVDSWDELELTIVIKA